MVSTLVIKGTNAADHLEGTDTASRLATGLSQALFAASAPGDNQHLFVLQKTGQIRVLDTATGQLQSQAFLDLAGRVSTTGEQGLLGLAFDPNHAANGKFYVYVSNLAGDVEIRQYTRASGALTADPASMRLITTINFPDGTDRHRGGWIGFGPDGYLYAAVGDGARSANSQSLANPMGKILRLDVSADASPNDPGRNYALPADNPTQIDGISGSATGTGIYAAGLRNPWRVSFDRATGQLYIADVGENTAEEVNLGSAGANYGWPGTEGGFDPANYPDYTQPIHSYGRAEGRSITGGYVYRGPSEALQGHYIFGDYATGRVWSMSLVNGAWQVTQRTVTADAGGITRPSSFGEDGAGNVYLIDYDGEIFRLNPQVTSGGQDLGDTIFARGGDDVVFGGSGDDTIDGGTGSDVMAGGIGNDRYIIDAASDVVEEEAGEGTEDVIRSAVSYALADDVHVEVLWTKNTSGTAAIHLTGNSHDNRISGNAAGNILTGQGGVDLIKGLKGNDSLLGGDGDDDLRGEDGDDRLEGGAGADKLDGGVGQDALLGGSGGDRFVWRTVAETASVAGSADRVLDFTGADGDLLDLSRIDADATRSGNQSFAFIGSSAFSAPGQIRLERAGNETLILLNTDRDTAAEAVIALAGTHDMRTGWFVL